MTSLFSLAVLLLGLFPGQAGQPAEPTETLIRLKVRAAAAPKPALRYQLLPELREMNPGNPVMGYLKCFMEQNPFFFKKEVVDEREKLEDMPLKDLAKKKLRGYGGTALTQADYAARLDNPDWQTLLKLRSDGYYLLIPEVQQLRSLAQALKVRFRIEVAAGRTDEALVTAKTLFALARHLGEHPTLIADLVGIAVAFRTIEPLEELLQQPGCPNLFWALTHLPRPFIDLRRGMQGERLVQAQEFSRVKDQEPMTAAQLQKLLDHFNQLLAAQNLKGLKLSEWAADRSRDADHVQAARKRLVEHGLAVDLVKQFPALQVVLLDGKLSLEVREDEAMKAMMLPYWQAEPLLGVAQGKEELPFFWLVSGVGSVRRAQARLEQRFALLRCVEALRLYAAAHDGKLPAKLADVPVPVPDDPMTGQPFLYQLDGTTAHLRGTPPPSMAKVAAYRIHYQITIEK